MPHGVSQSPDDLTCIGNIPTCVVKCVDRSIGLPVVLRCIAPAQSPCLGVIHSRDDPHPLAPLRRPDVLSTHHERRCGVTDSFQIPENPVCAASSQSRDILNNDPSGSKSINDTVHLPPQARSRPGIYTQALPRTRNILARKAADHTIHRLKSVRVQRGYVVMARHVRPVLGQHRAAERVEFALANDDHARPLGAQVKAADAAKE